MRPLRECSVNAAIVATEPFATRQPRESHRTERAWIRPSPNEQRPQTIPYTIPVRFSFGINANQRVSQPVPGFDNRRNRQR